MINKLKKQFSICFVFLIFIITPMSILAVPAYPGPMLATQVDGTQFTLFGFGDEFFSWAETADGHIVAVDPESGNWHYAEISPDGRIVAGPEVDFVINPRNYI